MTALVQPGSPRARARLASVAVIAAMLLTAIAAVALPTTASAATPNGDDFQAGLIVTNQNFFNYNAMTIGEIQTFLNKVGPSNCNGCLRKYTANTYDRDGNPKRCPDPVVGKENVTAAEMIYDVAQACHINPMTLLVILQKETSLVTLKAPESWRYQRAMGYACPDSAPCNTDYYGLFIQLYSAASQLQWYGNPDSPFKWYPVNDKSYIKYHPKSSCGVRGITIKNKATAALYYYTPYTPNKAALANITGTGDKCSSYGNRNFWRLWNQWFGDPTVNSGDEPDPTPSPSASPSPSPSPSPSVTERPRRHRRRHRHRRLRRRLRRHLRRHRHRRRQSPRLPRRRQPRPRRHPSPTSPTR